MAEFVSTLRGWARRAPIFCFFLISTLLAAGCSNVGTSHGNADPPTTLTFGTTSLPYAQVGVPYSASLVASGGTVPYSFALTGGVLPAGLSLNSATGALSGTATTSSPGVALTFTVTDAGDPAQSASATLTLIVSATPPSALAITTVSLPGAQVGTPYSMTLAASGGTTPYTWALTGGTLPAGLTFNAASGILSGTPTATSAGTALSFMVSDAGAPPQTRTATFTLVVSAPTIVPLTITTATLPPGKVGQAYSAPLTATGGTTPYTWAITAGALPAGLSFNTANGQLSGTPTASTTGTTLTFKVTDAANPAQTTTANLTLSVAPVGLTITTTSLPPAQAGVAYNATLAATGGTKPYTWAVSGSVPAGLSLNSATGTLSGTPTAITAGAPLTFSVTDSGNPAQNASTTLTLVVSVASLAITTTSLPAAQVAVPYSTTLTTSGGTKPYTWVLTGTLPAGLSFNTTTGTLSGTPSAVTAGTSLTFKVTDAGTPPQSSSKTFTLVIKAATLAVSSISLPSGQVGKAYTTTLAATGGTTPYTWAVTGTLPAGLSFNTASGVLSGTPSASTAGVSLTFKVTDSGTPAQNASRALTLVIVAATPVLTITTVSLPPGHVGTAYSTTLTASGGTTPYTWSLVGTLPAGLAFNTTTGVLSGTPTASAAATPLQFTVKDSGNPVQSQTQTFTLTINAGAITVTVAPRNAALTLTQTLSVSATTNDAAGVRWTVSPAGGSFSPATSLSGAKVTFTAAATAGVYTVTATSVSDATATATINVGVTDLKGVYTYHNDVSRDGANTQEYGLSLTNLSTSTFGKLFSCTVDGAVYAQPLWVANLTIGGARHNVVFVATEHDSLFAFDADSAPCVKLWQVSLIDTAHGGNAAGETSVPAGTTGYLVGMGLGNLAPEAGVTSTPVIDPSSGIIYVVTKSVVSGTTNIFQRLHAIDITTGNEKTGSPATVSGSVTGTGSGGTTVAFSPQQENQRAGLALVNGTVYIAWGSHEDAPPWFGWVATYTYSGSAFVQNALLNVTPNVAEGGIWMSGGAPAADSSGHVYLITGNGGFDANSTTAPNNDYGDTFMQLSGSGLKVTSWFTPSDQLYDAQHDNDFGSGGAALVLNLSSGTLQHLIIGGGKDATLYLLNGDKMGGLGDGNAYQHFTAGSGLYCSPAFWNNTVFVAPIAGSLEAYTFEPSSNMFITTLAARTSTVFGYPGGTASISAQGASANGIAWILDNSNFCIGNSQPCGPAVLHAYNANNLYSELWNSSMVSSDAAGNAVKFVVPTVANGKVYVATRGNNKGGVSGSTSVAGELDVYGFKPN
jgi:Putative Ig domain